jgi:hypothetical protein
MNATYRDFRTTREQHPPGFGINGSNYESQVSEEEIRAALAALRKPSPIGRPPPSTGIMQREFKRYVIVKRNDRDTRARLKKVV